MKINYITAKEKFDFAVWNILDGIERDRLPYPNKEIIDCMVSIDIRSLSKSQFYEVRHFLKANKVLKEVGEPVIYESGVVGTPEYQVFNIFHFKILQPFDEYYRKYTNLVNGGIDASELFGFEDFTFWLKLVNGSKATINFNPKGNRKYPTQSYYLFRALIQLLKNGKWIREGDWLEISVTQKEIIDEIKKLQYLNQESLSSIILSNMRNNLINKSLPSNFKNLIKLSSYETKSGTYSFCLKIPS